MTTRTNCSIADLTAGTVVREAELELTASGLIFEEIELVGELDAGGGAPWLGTIRATGRHRPYYR